MTTFVMLIAAVSAQTMSVAAVTPVAVPALELPVAAAASAAVQTEPHRYCIREIPTGSRIIKKTCKTRAEWKQDGVDIDAK